MGKSKSNKSVSVSGQIDRRDGLGGDEASLAGAALQQVAQQKEVTYIVNPRGCVHEVSVAHARALISANPRYRYATEAEIAAYLAADGNQMFSAPLGQSFDGALAGS